MCSFVLLEDREGRLSLYWVSFCSLQLGDKERLGGGGEGGGLFNAPPASTMMAHNTPFLRLLVAALGLAVGAQVASGGSVLSSSTLESCTTTSGGLTANFCDTRLAVLYSVVSGQNDTDAIQVMLNEVQRSDQPTAAISSHDLRVTIRKTPIYFQYPTTYDRTYNYQAYELVAYGTTDSDGTFTYFNDNPLNFQALNTCVDSDDAESPSCGFAVDRCALFFMKARVWLLQLPRLGIELLSSPSRLNVFACTIVCVCTVVVATESGSRTVKGDVALAACWTISSTAGTRQERTWRVLLMTPRIPLPLTACDSTHSFTMRTSLGHRRRITRSWLS